MTISEKKMQIVIDNYFKSECDVNTSIRQAFEKGFRIGVEKGRSVKSDAPDTNVGDMIYRQAAIDLIMGQPPEAHYPSWYAEQIKGLPSAQPEIIQWETCFDCPLSHGCPVISGCTNEQAMEYAGEIPDNCPLNKISTEPERKTGKWIDDGTEFGCCCLECNFTLDDLFIGDLSEVHLKVFPRFCPNCGARMDMRGEQE